MAHLQHLGLDVSARNESGVQYHRAWELQHLCGDQPPLCQRRTRKSSSCCRGELRLLLPRARPALRNQAMTSAFITSLGKFLPGPPVSNEEMEDYLGKIFGKRSRARMRILKQNRICSRHYAIDKQQRSLYSNAQMAALAVRDALERTGFALATIDFLAAATSQGDFPLPGFASFVHAELGTPVCEIASHHGVCAGGVAALKHASLQIESGKKVRAVACASEFASRLLKASRYEAQSRVAAEGLSFETEFLRWMLSDGGGAALVEPGPGGGPLALRIEWIELKSYA